MDKLSNSKNDFKKEVRALITITLPLTAAQLAQFAIGFIDTVMAGNVGTLDLAAVSLGSSIWFIVSIFLIGIIMAIPPIVSQLKSSQKEIEIPIVIQQGIWLSSLLGIIAFFVLRNIKPMFTLMAVEEETALLAIEYINGISWGLPAFAIYLAIRGYCEGIAYTRLILKIALISLVINTVANYILIYGKLGFPKLGGPGCGWASSFTLWVSTIIMIIYTKKNKTLASIPIWNHFSKPDLHEIAKITRLGLPIGATVLSEVSAFSLVAIFLSSISAVAVASHQIALNFASFLFMIPLSLAMGSTILVGQHVGQKKYDTAKLTSICSTTVAVGFAILSSSFIYFFPGAIANFYSNDPVVVGYVMHLLMYAAVFQISDSLQVSLLGCLRGYKDTKIPMFMSYFSYWLVAIPLGYVLGMTNYVTTPMGASGFWIGLVSGLTISAFLLGCRLYYITNSHIETHSN